MILLRIETRFYKLMQDLLGTKIFYKISIVGFSLKNLLNGIVKLNEVIVKSASWYRFWGSGGRTNWQMTFLRFNTRTVCFVNFELNDFLSGLSGPTLLFRRNLTSGHFNSRFRICRPQVSSPALTQPQVFALALPVISQAPHSDHWLKSLSTLLALQQ